MPPELSIVIPIHNEDAILESAIASLCAELDALTTDYEIILAENGSNDRTVEQAQALAQGNSRIRCLSIDQPNYGRALKAGMLAARGTYVICDEIDLCDVDFYQRALPMLRTGEADLVVGSKAMSGAHDHRPLVRRAATRVINGLLRLTLDFHGTDTHGLKAFVREPLLDIIEKCVVERDLFASEFVIRAERSQQRVKEIPVRVEEKRRPAINLMRRVPRVVGNLARLTYVFWKEPRNPT
jgi:glycosyltransferase involved in cell wall biosynthesis